MTSLFDDTRVRREVVANWMINEARSIVISGHREPDQDSLGSQMAMFHVLRDTFSDKEILSVIDQDIVSMLVEGGMSGTFHYLDQPGSVYVDAINNSMSDDNFDLFIGLDCATYDRLPDKVQDIARKCKNKLFFDHHPGNDSDCRFNVVNDPDKPSTTSLLYEFFKKTSINNFTVSSLACNALYFGLVGDTGNFTNNNTDTYTLTISSELSKNMSVEPSKISRFCSQKSFSELMSLADVVNNARRELDDRFVYYVHGNHNDSIADGFSPTNNPVDMLTKLKGYQLAMTAVAIDEEKYRVSLRSSGRYTVNDVAANYNGGGHELAAGCVCSDSELDSLISDLRDKLKSIT